MPLKVGDGPVAPVPPAPREEGKRKTGSLGGREVAFSGSHQVERRRRQIPCANRREKMI